MNVKRFLGCIKWLKYLPEESDFGDKSGDFLWAGTRGVAHDSEAVNVGAQYCECCLDGANQKHYQQIHTWNHVT